MLDLSDRLQELADAATRDGITPGPAHAIRRGRRRRRRITAGIASLLAVTLVAGAAGVAGRLPDRAATRPVAPVTTPSTTLAPVQPSPPSGAIDDQLWRDVKTALGECGVQVAAGPRLIARGTAYGKRWMLGARPPRAGGKGMCWASGEAGHGGGGEVGANGSATSPSREIVASGSQGETYGSVYGYVTRRAATVRVAFRDGRPALQVPVRKAGAAFPVNFYIAYYPQPGPSEGWAVDQVVALDPSGREVARCRERPDPGTCVED
jgi:hypothetical protein